MLGAHVAFTKGLMLTCIFSKTLILLLARANRFRPSAARGDETAPAAVSSPLNIFVVDLRPLLLSAKKTAVCIDSFDLGL